MGRNGTTAPRCGELLVLKCISFEHSITKNISRIDLEEKGGGILADEMGMGKSLSILSLLTKTLHEAGEWATSQRLNDTNASSKKYSRATLIVVSSAREYNPCTQDLEVVADETVLINGWFAEIDR